MRAINVPRVNARYWAAIIAASMCGTNMGDFFAEYLHLGTTAGIAPILAIFGAIVWLERRSTMPTEIYYWLAIILLRTVATNIADFATFGLKLGYPLVEAGLTILLVALVASERLWRRAPVTGPTVSAAGVPNTDMAYWAAMLTAGTLGTATGDFIQGRHGFALGSGPASIIMTAVFLIVLLLAWRVGGMAKPWYWAAVVAARTAGTNIGDHMAERHGLALGLPVSLTITSALLASIVIAWPRGASERLPDSP